MWALPILLRTGISKNYSAGVDGFEKGPPSLLRVSRRNRQHWKPSITETSEQLRLTDSFFRVPPPIFPWSGWFLSWCHVQNFRTIAFIVSTQRPLKYILAHSTEIFPFFRPRVNFDPRWNGHNFRYRKREMAEKLLYFRSLPRSKPRVSKINGCWNMSVGMKLFSPFKSIAIPPPVTEKQLTRVTCSHTQLALVAPLLLGNEGLGPDIKANVNNTHTHIEAWNTCTHAHTHTHTYKYTQTHWSPVSHSGHSETANELSFYIGGVSQHTHIHTQHIHQTYRRTHARILFTIHDRVSQLCNFSGIAKV